MLYLGETASLLCSVSFAATAILFGRAGERVGSATVNLLRLGGALVAMFALHLAMTGTWFPAHAGLDRIALMGVSGLIGFALGDALLFEAYVQLGPRLTVLIFTLWPVFAALMAWSFLAETMGLGKAVGMLVTLAGIALVVSKRDSGSLPARIAPRHYVLGVLLAIGGAAGQAIGFILAKVGMAGGLSPIGANLIRVIAGALGLWTWQALAGHLVPNLAKLKDARAVLLIGIGTLVGPVVGIVASLYAINHAQYLGVASTLMSLSPVMLLPFAWFVEKERISLRATVGTLVCLGGTAAMFLV
jgi:drug/metabolite transporter (DMT)-like permease